MSNIRGLRDTKPKDDSSDDEAGAGGGGGGGGRGGQNYYTGARRHACAPAAPRPNRPRARARARATLPPLGGSQSGLNVVAPKKGKGAVDDIMKLKGEAAGTKGSLVIKCAAHARARSLCAFLAVPYAHSLFLPPFRAVWKGGFTVGEGDLRAYETPEGAAFMAHIMAGRLPPATGM
jgi:hypothetical protein